MNEVDCCCCFAVDWMQASKQEFQFSNCRRTLHFDGVVVVMIISRFTIHYLISLIYSFAVCTISSHCLDQKEEVRFFINGWLRNEKRHKLNSCFISTNREIWQHRERARTREKNCFLTSVIRYCEWLVIFFSSSSNNNNKNNSFSLCFLFWGSLFFFSCNFLSQIYTHTHAQFQLNCVEYWHPHTTKYIISPLYTLVIYFSYTISLLLVIVGIKI